jgi:HAMP domain-containing protein
MYETRNLMLGGSAALVMIAMLCGWLLTRRTLAPVSAVTAAARHIADTGRFDTRLSMGDPKDELTSLAATFDLMIERIERIIGQQRDFLADTSHELRNPLSIICGNLDFVRRVSTDEASLESLHEAELEAVRMSRLVDDLLLLAQAIVVNFWLQDISHCQICLGRCQSRFGPWPEIAASRLTAKPTFASKLTLTASSRLSESCGECAPLLSLRRKNSHQALPSRSDLRRLGLWPRYAGRS